MKKGLKLTAVALLAVSMLAGCGGKEEKITSGTASADRFEDMQKGENVDGKEVNKIFNDALVKVGEVDSATIDMEVSVHLVENGEEVSNKNTTSIKFMPGEASKTEKTNAAQNETEESAGTQPEAEEQTASKVALVDMTNEGNGTTQNISGYFENDKFYYNISDSGNAENKEVKVVRPMLYEELMSVFGGYGLQFNDDVVESAAKVESKDETKYIIQFNAQAMADMMLDNLASAGAPLSDNEDMNIDTAYMYFAVDNEGVIKGYDMELEAQFTSKESNETATEASTGEQAEPTLTESPFKYSIVANFTDINSTKVEAYSDLDSYRDVNEVMAELQSEAAAASENASEMAEETTSAEN